MVQLMNESYEKDTPVAVVYKASWPEETIIYGTLETIADKVKAAGITKTALVVVGDFLGDKYELSNSMTRILKPNIVRQAVQLMIHINKL